MTPQNLYRQKEQLSEHTQRVLPNGDVDTRELLALIPVIKASWWR